MRVFGNHLLSLAGKGIKRRQSKKPKRDGLGVSFAAEPLQRATGSSSCTCLLRGSEAIPHCWPVSLKYPAAFYANFYHAFGHFFGTSSWQCRWRSLSSQQTACRQVRASSTSLLKQRLLGSSWHRINTSIEGQTTSRSSPWFNELQLD
jgi:hypothetical protein